MSELVEMVMQAAAFFSLVNVVLLVGLITIYSNSLRKIRAEFTVGLLFFAAFFLLQNLFSLYSYVTMFMYYASSVTGLVLTITIAQTAGLAILLWTGLR